jgi:penicillin-binding protein 1A
VVFLAGLGICGALAGSLALALAWPNLPDLSAMIDYKPRVPLRIYTADHVLIGEFGEERRNVLRFDEIPDVMKSAILAAEDDRFYQHGGIDWLGVARAALANVVNMSKAQGASTITMQVARNFYLSSEKTYTRKFYELLLTFKIESTLSKDEILDLYMNQIYLGHRSYGFAAACRTYFGKPLGEITLAEAAMLAGIPKAPSRFNPMANMQRAKTRQGYVLGRMLSLGYITQDEYNQAMKQPIVLKSAPGTVSGEYLVHADDVAELARRLLYTVYHDDIYSKGFNIYTTIDSKGQEAAYQSLREGVLDYTRRAPYPGPEETIKLPEGIEKDPARFQEVIDGIQDKYNDSGDLLVGLVLSASPDKVVVARSADQIVEVTDKSALRVVARGLVKNAKPDVRIERGSVVYIRKNGDTWELLNMPSVQAAFVAVRPEDGAIKAMVGGFGFEEHFNRVTQAWRQPGSSFKPFVYASALERGLTPATQISDEPFSLTAEQTGSKPWSPKNYGNAYEPMLTMRQGLYKSKNMVSIRIMQAVGPQYVQDYVTRFGFDPDRNPAVLPLALGAGAVTPLQLAGAYSVFANGGYRVPPYLIDHVTDSNGKVIMQAKPVVAGDSTARVIDPRTAYVMDDMLRGVAREGTAARLARDLKRIDVAGKTGTTNESHDAWFAGFTPKIVGIAWMGYDQPKSLGTRETGGGAALPIWLGYMKEALKDKPQIDPGPPPDGLMKVDGDYYFSEFPPGKAVARVGLPSPEEMMLNGQVPTGPVGAGAAPSANAGGQSAGDGIGALLNQLGNGNRGGNDRATSGDAAETHRVQF